MASVSRSWASRARACSAARCSLISSAASSAAVRIWSAAAARRSASARADSAVAARCSAALVIASTSISVAVGSPRVATVPVSRVATPVSVPARSRIWRSISAPCTRAIVTGCSVSASVVVTPRSASASRFRSRHAVTLLWPGSAQYSGGRPGPAARSGVASQPGYLQVAVLVCSVIVALLGGSPGPDPIL